RAMLPPIRPSPTIPISMAPLSKTKAAMLPQRASTRGRPRGGQHGRRDDQRAATERAGIGPFAEQQCGPRDAIDRLEDADDACRVAPTSATSDRLRTASHANVKPAAIP